MTREEAIVDIRDNIKPVVGGKSLDMAIEALEQKTKTEQFAKWVATEIFDDMWEYNYEAFTEIACRKLAKLGIVRENGNQWELVEQESEDTE